MVQFDTEGGNYVFQSKTNKNCNRTDKTEP